MAVLAIGADDVVGRAQRRDGADAHALLPDAEVQKAPDLALRVGLGRRFLDAADGEHLAIQLHQELPLRRICFLVPLSIHGAQYNDEGGGSRGAERGFTNRFTDALG
jgi:hypothetical protein